MTDFRLKSPKKEKEKYEEKAQRKGLQIINLMIYYSHKLIKGEC